jgi:hypothetical protein
MQRRLDREITLRRAEEGGCRVGSGHHLALIEHYKLGDADLRDGREPGAVERCGFIRSQMPVRRRFRDLEEWLKTPRRPSDRLAARDRCYETDVSRASAMFGVVILAYWS